MDENKTVNMVYLAVLTTVSFALNWKSAMGAILSLNKCFLSSWWFQGKSPGALLLFRQLIVFEISSALLQLPNSMGLARVAEVSETFSCRCYFG